MKKLNIILFLLLLFLCSNSWAQQEGKRVFTSDANISADEQFSRETYTPEDPFMNEKMADTMTMDNSGPVTDIEKSESRFKEDTYNPSDAFMNQSLGEIDNSTSSWRDMHGSQEIK